MLRVLVDNAAGIMLSQNLTVSQGLTMTSGNINTGTDTLTLGESVLDREASRCYLDPQSM